MEKVTAESHLVLADELESKRVASTVIGYKSHFDVMVQCQTSIESANLSGNFNFQINPLVAAELDPTKCMLVCRLKVRKNNGAYGATDQISMPNFPGPLFIEKTKLMIGGQPVMEEYPVNNDISFIEMSTKYDEKTKENTMFSLGYRFDEVNKASTRDTTMDKPCFCRCWRCLCVMYDTSATSGSSGCVVADYDTLLTTKKRSAVDITAIKTRYENFNIGTYMRSGIIAESAGDKDGFTFLIPLSLLNKFFAIPSILPCKRVMSLEFVFNPASKCLIKPATDTNAYSIKVEDIQLCLSYVVLESQIRSSYYSAIASSNIVRSFQHYKVNHFTLNKTLTTHWIPNCLAFSVIPKFLCIYFTDEERHLGNWSNRYLYTHNHVSALQCLKAGQEVNSNQHMNNMKLDNVLSPNCAYLYSEFCKLMNPDFNVSFERFYYDCFVFVIDLGQNPIHLKGRNTMELVSSGSLDLQITFSQNPTTNLICNVCGFFDNCIKIDASGMVIGDE